MKMKMLSEKLELQKSNIESHCVLKTFLHVVWYARNFLFYVNLKTNAMLFKKYENHFGKYLK